MMDCQRIEALLDDLVADRLDAATAAQVTAHLADCEACRDDLGALHALRDAAAGLPAEITPPRDLWPGIAEQLGGARDTAPAGEVVRPPASLWRGRLAYLPHAAMLAAGLALFLLLPRLDHGDGPAEIAATPSSEVGTLDASYKHVRADLDAALAARCDNLPGTTCSDLKNNVAMLDESASAVRSALRRAGGDPRETVLLINTYQLTIDRARGLASRLSRL